MEKEEFENGLLGEGGRNQGKLKEFLCRGMTNVTFLLLIIILWSECRMYLKFIAFSNEFSMAIVVTVEME